MKRPAGSTPLAPSTINPVSARRPALIFVLGLLALLLTLTAQVAAAATACGGNGQRACCVTERPPGTSCDPGFREVPGCTGDCKCGGVNPFDALNSIGHCEPLFPPQTIVPCGGQGQRACCVIERPGQPSCNPGLHEVLGCNGNCTCGGPNPTGAIKSLGMCVANPPITACGGPGQRACCVTERPGQPSCNPGSHEVLGCNGNCVCGGPNPGFAIKSLGMCVANPPITSCGGVGQRACCVTERPGQPPCNQGLHEEGKCTGNCVCGGPNPGFALKSIGVCVANPAQPPATPCGAQGQRACCITERPINAPGCKPGFYEVQGCNLPDCRCGGNNPAGVVNSTGHCEPTCETAKAQLEAELAKTKAELDALKKGGSSVSGTKAPAPQPKLQQPMIKQAPPLLRR
jgi:hypothetical protein